MSAFSLSVNGALTSASSINLSNGGVNLQSGDPFNVTMTYSLGKLTVTMSDATTNAFLTKTYLVNIPSVLGDSQAYVGFTDALGNGSASLNVLNWTLQSQ